MKVESCYWLTLPLYCSFSSFSLISFSPLSPDVVISWKIWYGYLTNLVLPFSHHISAQVLLYIVCLHRDLENKKEIHFKNLLSTRNKNGRALLQPLKKDKKKYVYMLDICIHISPSPPSPKKIKRNMYTHQIHHSILPSSLLQRTRLVTTPISPGIPN